MPCLLSKESKPHGVHTVFPRIQALWCPYSFSVCHHAFPTGLNRARLRLRMMEFELAAHIIAPEGGWVRGGFGVVFRSGKLREKDRGY